MTKISSPDSGGLSTDKILSKCFHEAERHLTFSEGIKHLDIGAGNGALLSMLHSKFGTTPYACDYTDELMQIEGLDVTVCDLNCEKLPYEDNYFDLVTFTEVIEHIENHRNTLSDIFRILKPNGVLVLSTPNILNLKSRLRFLFCGFWNLFGPLTVGNRKIESTGGHINPVSYFYVVHSLMEAGLEVENDTYDKIQSSSVFLLLFLYAPIKLYCFFHFRKEKQKYKTIDERNQSSVLRMNTFDLLVGRTIIVTARKKK